MGHNRVALQDSADCRVIFLISFPRDRLRWFHILLQPPSTGFIRGLRLNSN